MQRALVVSSSYPFRAGDHHSLFVHELARHLATRYFVDVLAPAPPGTLLREQIGPVRVHRFEYPGSTRAPLVGGPGIPDNLRAHPLRTPVLGSLAGTFLVEVRRAVRRVRPALLVSNWLVPAGLACARAAPGVAKVHVAHSSDVHLLKSLGWIGRALGRAIEDSGPVLATSHSLAEELGVAHVVERPRRWWLGVEVPPQVERSDRGGPLRACAMGRLVEVKGFERLVSLVARTDLHLEIAGDGPLEGALRTRIDALGVGERIKLVGPLVDDQKLGFFARADLYAFTPRLNPSGFVDNLPVSVLEAMASGLPVVSTPVGALPELLSSGGGLIVEDDDDALVSAFSSLERRALRSLSVHALALAESRSWPRAIDELISASRIP